MVSNQQFRLKWNNHRNTVLQEFETLLHNNSFVDCTIGADGKYLKAHKIVLSACSPYLQNVFNEHFDKHPVILLKDVSFKELKCMIDYMYCGEVNISECELPSFLRTAQSLKIKGLAEDIGDYDSGSDNEHSESSSFPSENKRIVEANADVHDGEPPAKKIAPSLISANANNTLTARKRKTPNSVPITGKPNTSSQCKSVAPTPNTSSSNSSKPAEVISSSNNDSENESERTANTSTTENCVNPSDHVENTVGKSTSPSDTQEPRGKDVKEEPVDTDADHEDDSSYEYMNNPCDDSDQLNEDSESNCTTSGNKFADVSIGNVSTYNENDANDEENALKYFKEEVELVPVSPVEEQYIVQVEKQEEEQQPQEGNFSLFSTFDGDRDAQLIEYNASSNKVHPTPTLSASPTATTAAIYPSIYGQVIPINLRKILPRECTLLETLPSESPNLKVTTLSSQQPKLTRKTLHAKPKTVTVNLAGYRKILPAPVEADPIGLPVKVESSPKRQITPKPKPSPLRISSRAGTSTRTSRKSIQLFNASDTIILYDSPATSSASTNRRILPRPPSNESTNSSQKQMTVVTKNYRKIEAVRKQSKK